MLEIEQKSGLSSFDLINLVGKKLATHLLPYLDVKSNILVLAGMVIMVPIVLRLSTI